MRMRKFYTLFILGLISLQAFAQDDIPVYCLDNEKVAGYFSTPEYDPNDYSYTYILDYCYELPWNWKNYGKGERLDQPLPAKVKLTNALAVEGTLYVSENEDYSDALVKSMASGTDSIDVYNLIPNRTYNWKVVNSASGAVIESGKFKTTGHVRMLKIDGIFNVRDMGGWIGLGGNPIKYGKIIRGSRLNVNSSTQKIITPEGIEELRRLGIRAELDMRDQGNAPMEGGGERHSYLGEDIPIVNIDGAYNSRIATFADAPQSIQGIQKMIDWFKQDKPVYLHCSVGADRTGTVAYLVGALCGMSEDALAREFELTSFSGDSVDNEADRGTWEILVRQRTGVGRLDACSSPESYRFSDMVAKIKSFPGGTFQRKVYNHLKEGVNGTKISPEDLSFLVNYLTGFTILGGFDCGIDTIRLDKGQTFKFNITPQPAGATYSSVSFKSISPDIATVSSDGTVTAVGGGTTYILVDVDGIEKYIPVIVPITAESIKVYSSYNSIIEQYMSESAYSDADYTESYIDKYMDMSAGGRRDWPQAFTLKWSANEGVTEQLLLVCDTTDYVDCAVKEYVSPNDSTYIIEGINPGRIYYYMILGKLSSGETLTLCSSAFVLRNTVKMIKLEEIYNVRDLGGWTGLNGKVVKYGVLYRGSRIRRNSDQPKAGNVFTDDAHDLKNMGINAELDFRGTDENAVNKPATDSPAGCRYKQIPNAKDCLGSNILNGDAYIAGLKQIITWLKGNRKVYISASLGADRTGAMAFLINGLLGVDEDGLARDYELSSFTEDTLAAGKIWKRNEGNYPAMVSAIKTLEGNTLQEKIYNYFKVGYTEGTKVTAVTEENLNWFIDYMLESPKTPLTDVEPVTVDDSYNVIKRQSNGKIFNMFGFEADITKPGLYIIDGKTVYVTE